MPPKRSRSGSAATTPSATTPSKIQKMDTKKNRGTPTAKNTKTSTRTREIREDSPPGKDFDSYDDAVRDAVLNTTRSRYDLSLEQDHFNFAASLMELSLPLSMSAENDKIMSMTLNGGVTSQNKTESGSHRKIYSLATYCMHAIVKNFEYLAVDAITSATPVLSSSVVGSGIKRGPQRGLNDRRGSYFRRHVQQLPFYLSERLFKLLKHSRPELLSTKIWTGLFFHPNTIYVNRLDNLDLEGLIPSQVTDTVLRTHLLRTIGIGPCLTRINLNHQTGLSDKAVADLVGAAPNLSRLFLKGCTRVGDLTLGSLPSDSLEELNISFAAACTGKGIGKLILQCRRLKVFKVAGLANIKDAVFVQLEKALALEKEETTGSSEGTDKDVVDLIPLAMLENLKISTTSLGDRGLKVLLALCGRSLRRLDISQTNVTRPSLIGQYCVWSEEEKNGATSAAKALDKSITRLEKLNLTRLTMSTSTELSTLMLLLPANSLHTLLVGYIAHSRAVFSDEVFDVMSSSEAEEDGPNQPDTRGGILTSFVAKPKFFLRTLSLFGNHDLGKSVRDRDALRWHLSTLAPYLKRLELGYTNFDHQVLLGLIDPPRHRRPHPQELEQQSIEDFKYNDVLEELGMDATRIGDESALVLSKLRELRRLSLANTQMTRDAIEIIVEGCPKLNSLDLTSCRGVPVMQRRTLLKDLRQRASYQS
ncbi:hypothetical protein FBU30_007341 [Linnemannia zychae]|nr:hypothetical protein FBU30_007341 [Linnemannia zychae]